MLKGNFYRNLDRKHPESWSMQVKGADGKVKAHRVACAVCYDLKVGGLTSQQFERCIAGTGPRKVFAWFKGRIEPNTQRSIEGLRRVYFNPTKGQRFFHTSDGARVESAPYAVFTPTGEMFIP